jgi:hypothetical protein
VARECVMEVVAWLVEEAGERRVKARHAQRFRTFRDDEHNLETMKSRHRRLLRRGNETVDADPVSRSQFTGEGRHVPENTLREVTSSEVAEVWE